MSLSFTDNILARIEPFPTYFTGVFIPNQDLISGLIDEVLLRFRTFRCLTVPVTSLPMTIRDDNRYICGLIFELFYSNFELVMKFLFF